MITHNCIGGKGHKLIFNLNQVFRFYTLKIKNNRTSSMYNKLKLSL